MFADYSLLKVMLDQISAKIEFCRRCVRKAQLTLTCSRAGGLRLRWDVSARCQQGSQDMLLKGFRRGPKGVAEGVFADVGH